MPTREPNPAFDPEHDYWPLCDEAKAKLTEAHKQTQAVNFMVGECLKVR